MKKLVIIVGLLIAAVYAQAATVQINTVLKDRRNGSFNNLSTANLYTTAPDGTRMINIGNASQYSGSKTAGTIFHTISSVYVCGDNDRCKRIDR